MAIAVHAWRYASTTAGGANSSLSMTPSRRPSWVLKTMFEEAGDAAVVADQAPSGRLDQRHLDRHKAKAVAEARHAGVDRVVISASSRGGSSRPPSSARKNRSWSSRSEISAPAAHACEGL